MISRLHVGDSYITHSFLSKGEEPPVCIACDKQLTIEHILLNCSKFIEMREPFYSSVTMCIISRNIAGKNF